MDKKPLLAVAGVTASGKTQLGIGLCRLFDGEVVSADSMQIYQGMDIATAAPDAQERAAAPHHLVGFLSPLEEFSVADWTKRARETIADIRRRGRLPVVVGGTGLYLSALLDNLCFDGFSGDPPVRAELEACARAGGEEALFAELQAVDPALACKLHPHNRGRVIRALEVYRATGIPMSEHQRRARENEGTDDICLIALGYEDRENMWRRIDARVDRMMERGLLEEARQFYTRYPSRTAAAAIGYKELRPYLEGSASLKEAVDMLKLRTRQYAKRQLTWLRRDSRCQWLYVDRVRDAQELLRDAADIVRESGVLERSRKG